MPELPDLLYQRAYLLPRIRGRTVTGAEVRQPVVVRMAVPGGLQEAVTGRVFLDVGQHGPFLVFTLECGPVLVVNQMLAGRLQHQQGGRPLPGLAAALALDDGSSLNLCDTTTMAKLYVLPPGDFSAVPQFDRQGVDVLSPAFTPAVFRTLVAAHGRRQVRTFINDHTLVSAVGNAYADEILFAAGIHPKTFVARLTPVEVDRLHAAILSVLRDGIAAVEAAGKPIHVKVRDHMRVRGRHGKPCPRCGGIIRREGVRGYDVFFCPRCQPATRKLFLRWDSR